MRKNSFFILGMVLSIFASAATKPTFPGYSTCPVTNGVINATCVSDINYTYKTALAAYNKELGLVTDSYTGTTVPVKPTYSCSTSSIDNVCENSYATQVQQYTAQVNAYNAIQQQAAETAQLQAAAAQARVTTSTTSTGTSTSAALTTAIEENKSGAKQYTVIGVVTAAAAAYNFYKAATCAGTCSAPYVAAGVMFMLMSAAAGKQVESHNASKDSACTALAQVTSSSSSSCSAATDTYVSTTPAGQITAIADQIDPNTGTCKTTAPATCATIVAVATEKGVDVKSLVSGASQFAGTNSPVKVNPDGSVTTKDGKTYKASDFKDEASMIAAGISPADAKSLMNDLNSSNGIIAKAGIDAKGDLKDLAKPDFGTFGSNNFGSSSSSGSSESASTSGGLGSKESAGKRKPSSSTDGLVRTFNGDTIGIANDDIFKMMNKRYKLKSAQDAFIGQ